MKPSDISFVQSVWGVDPIVQIRSFHEISAVENPRPDGKTHAIENKRAGKKTAVWLDDVLAKWSDLEMLRKNNQPMPHRVDGCYVDGSDVYLVEFKADGDLERLKDNLWAKYHDTYAILRDRDLITLQGSRENLYYIVVTGTRLNWSDADFDQNYLKKLSESEKARILVELTTPMSEMLQRPWKAEGLLPKANLNVLTAYTCKNAWTMDFCQFDRFVAEKGWV